MIDKWKFLNCWKPINGNMISIARSEGIDILQSLENS
jgi:hypothetical protein